MILMKAKKKFSKVLLKKNYKVSDTLAKVDIDVNKILKKFKLEPDTEIGVSLYQTSKGKFCLTVLTKPFN